MVLHGPLHSLSDTIGINKATIRGLWSSNPQKCMLIVMLNNRSASFPICLIHNNFIKRGITTMCVLYVLLSQASNIKSISASIDSGKEVHNRFFPLCYSSNHPMVSRGVNIYPHQDLNQGSRLSDISVAPFTNWKNYKGSRPLIVPSILFPLDRPYIPSFVIRVPDMCTMYSIIYPFIYN